MVTVAVLVGLALVTGLLIGSRLGSSAARAAPVEGSVDVGFARDMQAHHNQAVQLSTLVRAATDDPEIDGIALDIALTQQQQSGQMYAWLEQWGLPQRSSSAPMAWMGHDHATGAGPMPGMATQAQVNALAAARGVAAERLFLSLMIDHHVAGVDMAAYAAGRAKEEPVRRLAGAMVAAQQSEISLLERLLGERGGRSTG